jgi:serpin B
MVKKFLLLSILSLFILFIGVSLILIAGYTEEEIKNKTFLSYIFSLGEGESKNTFTADDEGVTPEGVKAVEDANNEFALKIYKEIIKEEKENVFISPYSISTALAIVYEGAREETAEEIVSVFGFPEEDSVRRPAVASIYNRLNAENDNYEMKTANALWVQEDYNLLPTFTEATERFYGGVARNIDFGKDPEKAREIINSWVAEKTNDIIDELFPENSFSGLTRLVITNAIYFKGDWEDEFDEENTTESDFYVDSDETVQVEMMQKTDGEYRYYEDETVQVLEMPYKGEEVSMMVILPRENDLSAVENTITVDKIKTVATKSYKQEVDVYLPKFELETDYSLISYLEGLGMNLSFGSGADFSGMNGDKSLFIGKVVHSAYITVDEKGTEAAAATGVVMMESAMPEEKKQFKADHPFIFIIQEKTGNILFMGRVVNPTL